MDVRYRAARGAEVTGPGSMIYTLTAEPQALVTPEALHVNVTWPAGYAPTDALPTGWKATAKGATYSGPVAEETTWEIPLAKS